jgi:transketolase
MSQARAPGLVTLRPADANQVVEAWRLVMGLRHRPAAFVLSRQNLPTIDRSRFAPASGVARGGYVLAKPTGGPPSVVLLASGSEVSLSLAAHEDLCPRRHPVAHRQHAARGDLRRQSQAYRDAVLAPEITARVAVEQASTFGWERYVGARGAVIGMRTFGASAPLKALQQKFGFTPDRIVETARGLVAAGRASSEFLSHEGQR